MVFSRTKPAISLQKRPGVRGGFTLIELMVVVVIIGLFAAMAAPGIAQRIDAYALRSDAERVANLYRNARLRAMGRGSAVLVRFDGGKLEIREAVWGAAGTNPLGDPIYSAGCDNLPSPSCTASFATRWDDGDSQNQLLETFDPKNGGKHIVTLEAPSAVTPSNKFDVCFTPMGRAFSRSNIDDGAFNVMSGVPRINIERTVGVGLQVLVLPNGATRVTAKAP